MLLAIGLINSAGVASHIERLACKRSFTHITTALPKVLRKRVIERRAERTVNDQEVWIVGHLIKKMEQRDENRLFDVTYEIAGS